MSRQKEPEHRLRESEQARSVVGDYYFQQRKIGRWALQAQY
jgi:hypothetical protein